MIGVTELIEAYKWPKDWEAIAEKYAKKHGNTPEFWLRSWEAKRKAAEEFGKFYHDRNYSGSGSGIKPTELSGTYQEFTVRDEYFQVVGRMDEITFEGKFCEIIDVKTTDKLVMEPRVYFNGRRKVQEKFMPPISKLGVCNFNEAQLQLSIYGFLLERQGYYPRKLTIKHPIFLNRKKGYDAMKEDPSVDRIDTYQVAYLRQEAQAMLQHYAKNLRDRERAGKTVRSNTPVT